MRRRILMAMTGLLMSSVALAESSEKRTEYFWQPGGAMNALRLDWSMMSATYQRDYLGAGGVGANRGDATAWGNKQTLSYKYGLSPDWAIGAQLATGQNNVEFTPVGGNVQSTTAGNSGLYDLVLTAENTTPFGVYALHYGAHLNYSLGQGKMATKSSEGSNQSGGLGLSPYLGASWDLGSAGFIGGVFTYMWKGDRNVSPQRNNYAGKLKGGDKMDLSAFYEYHSDMWIADLRLGLTQINDDKYSVTDQYGNGSDTKAEARMTSYAAIAGQYYFMPTGSLRLSYRMDMIPDYKWDKDNGAMEYAHNNNTVNLAARFEF